MRAGAVEQTQAHKAVIIAFHDLGTCFARPSFLHSDDGKAAEAHLPSEGAVRSRLAERLHAKGPNGRTYRRAGVAVSRVGVHASGRGMVERVEVLGIAFAGMAHHVPVGLPSASEPACMPTG